MFIVFRSLRKWLNFLFYLSIFLADYGLSHRHKSVVALLGPSTVPLVLFSVVYRKSIDDELSAFGEVLEKTVVRPSYH